MNKYSKKGLIPFLIFMSVTLMNGQVVRDPITNIYKLGGSSEIFIGFSTSGNVFTRQGILDVPEDLNNITKKEDALQYKYMDVRKTATAVGDFNGDGVDEVVTIRDNISGGKKITIPVIGKDLIMNGKKEYILEELNSMPYERLRITAGNYDSDIQDEFVVCYGHPGETIRLALFETDADLNITFIHSFKEIPYFDYNFDIASGDVDGDGIDEIVMVKNDSLLTFVSTSPPDLITVVDLYIMEFDPQKKELVKKKELNNKKLINKAPSGSLYSAPVINEMRIACGDLNIDGKDEFVVGWSSYYSEYREEYCTGHFLGICTGYAWRYYYNDMVFLNTFRHTHTGEIENVENLFVANSSYGTRAASAGQRIALSLKCIQMDNLGRDEVLINASSRFIVMGSADEGMGLKKWADINLSGGFLNIGGTETFLVADLNPDTATMDFNKEVILLLSNQSIVNQINKVADLTSFAILMIDTVSADTLKFLPSGPPYELPFEDDADIEVSAMVSGDFDLKSADLYKIGTPDVIPVSQLQYPLVILNAPPVHFDVLNGVIHDLCDAYVNDENPEFSALYNTVVAEQNTTSVEIENSMGFSTDFKAYAMAGGSGFETSVTTNWESGKSFYQEKSHNTLIEEAKQVYTEDYVLYSSIDYSYYRYPVFDNAGNRIGYIAILNPESDNFTSVWGSGNSWDHPGYIFNHEPGNILSYRTIKNSTDFCKRTADFMFCQFSQVPVTNTGNGSFKFTFENISSEGNSFSFSGGVGADLFTKIGIEGSATVELAPFGLGGSVSTDFRAGVSSELSANYSNSSLSTHNTELKNSFQIDGSIGRINESYDHVARYFITPYIYRSQSGALVLDYLIDLDPANDDWWVENYGQKPDLAFILPWRYATEKGSDNIKQSKLHKTSEIQFYPSVVSPGDTVCITTRVHNYSLLTFEDWLNVEYYLGDPDKGGVKLTDIYGETGSSKYSTMIYGAGDATIDFEEYLTFNWKVPDTVSCSPRIYAVIDPENEHDEIHENNNKGWNTLRILSCADCAYADAFVGTEEFDIENFTFKSYPNPVSTYSTIYFSLPAADYVKIEVYNMSGKKVATVTDSYFSPGPQEVEFYAAGLGYGMYFYRMTVGKSTSTCKLIVLK